jgi:hypothetical protein
MIMKTGMILLGIAAMTAVATTAYAQRCPGCGGSGAATYDATTETTVTGTIDEVRTIEPTGGAMGGVHLMVSTSSGLTEVHVGPAWYVSSKNITFAKGDRLTIVGSNTKMAGKDAVIAREITKGGQTLTLRVAKGFPLWSGSRRGR